jgi:hypothetical protein
MRKASVAIETTMFQDLLFWGRDIGRRASSFVTSDSLKCFSTPDSLIFGLISSQFTLSETFRISTQSDNTSVQHGPIEATATNS